MAEVTVHVRGEDIKMGPGDSVDLGTQGIIRWLTEEDADADRLVSAKRQREIRRTITLSRPREGRSPR